MLFNFHSPDIHSVSHGGPFCYSSSFVDTRVAAPPLVGRYCLFVRFSREVTEIGFLNPDANGKLFFFRSSLLNDSNGRQTDQLVNGCCPLFICIDGDGQPRRFHDCLRVTRVPEKQWGPRHRNRSVLTAPGPAYSARYLTNYRYTLNEDRGYIGAQRWERIGGLASLHLLPVGFPHAPRLFAAPRTNHVMSYQHIHPARRPSSASIDPPLIRTGVSLGKKPGNPRTASAFNVSTASPCPS